MRFRSSAGVLALGLVVIMGGCNTNRDDETQSSSPADLSFVESFERGAEGRDVTEENSVFNVLKGNPTTFEESPAPVDGSLVGRYASTGENIRTKVEFTASSGATRVFERVYLWLDKYPTDVMRFLTLETSPSVSPPGQDALALRMDRAGYVTVYDGATFDASHRSASPLPLQEWIRLEVALDQAEQLHGRSVLRVFTGSELDSDQSVQTVTVDHVDAPDNPVTTAAFGVLNRVTVDFSLDAIEVSTDDWVGPVDNAQLTKG